MKPKTFMVIAGEASGDALAAELIRELTRHYQTSRPPLTNEVQPWHNTGLAPRFFGAGGPRMKVAGVDLAIDLTEHSVIGIPTPGNYLKFRKLFRSLFRLALNRQPDAIICVDFSVFNHRFARAIKQHVRKHRGWFHQWNPKIIKYVSPQVWASREGRAYQMEQDFDLLLSIFPFEKNWYSARVPNLRVEFVGHPMVERLEKSKVESQKSKDLSPIVLFLPGSRENELKRHLPVMIEVARKIKSQRPARFWMVVPDQRLASRATEICKLNIWRELAEPTYDENAHPSVRLLIGNLPEILPQVDVAIASTGTVTMECAQFGVPTVALYKTSWLTYQVGKRIVKVKWLAMPNILANEEVFPEFIQHSATAQNIARATIEFLNNPERRKTVQAKLTEIVASLGKPGAAGRAAQAIVRLMNDEAMPKSD